MSSNKTRIMECDGVVVGTEPGLEVGRLSVSRGEIAWMSLARPADFLDVLIGAREPISGGVRVLGARPGTEEARSVTAVATQRIVFPPGLSVKEVCLYAIRKGAPPGTKPPLAKEVLAAVGFEGDERTRADCLDSGERFRLACALMLFRPVPLWVIEISASSPGSDIAAVVRRRTQQGGACVISADREVTPFVSRSYRENEGGKLEVVLWRP